MKTFRILLCIAGVLLSTVSARANVYATDIQLDGSLKSITNSGPSFVTISYRLNQPATLGVTVAIMQGTNEVATIRGGTNVGLNSVIWGATNNSGTTVGTGNYSIAITAAATGFTNWEQISVDTNAGMAASDPRGIDVDKNTNSAYYGRVIMSCAMTGGSPSSVPAVAQYDGLYKMNADGSQADEGWYGNANYVEDDGGDAPISGQMPNSFGYNPLIVRIGDDDRIYWCDDSVAGAIVACDIQATTNQLVINYAGYENNPDVDDRGINSYGIEQFDVTGTATTKGALWLVGTDGSPNWGIWMYHLKNGAADPADTEGTQAVTTGGDISEVTGAGCMVDGNLDIFVSQSVTDSGDPANRTVLFPRWNSGVLPPEAGGFKYADGTNVGQATWAVGTNDDSMTGISDTVINSRTQPTLVALPMAQGAPSANGYSGENGGIRVLNVANGSVVSVTNGATIQTLTNIDQGNWYTCAAWDNVGNLYGASPTTNLWRVWSPPGGNTNTTVAVAQVIVPGPFQITSITAVPTTAGCANVTIAFTAPGNLAASAFTLVSSSTVNGKFTTVAGAVITGSAGSYQAAFSNCSTQFYEIEIPGL